MSLFRLAIGLFVLTPLQLGAADGVICTAEDKPCTRLFPDTETWNVATSSASYLAPLDDDGRALYIVRFEEKPAVRYSGGIDGLKPTSPRVTGVARFDFQAKSTIAYRDWLATRQSQHLSNIHREIGRSVEARSKMDVSLNAVILNLTPSEAKIIKQLPGIAWVERNRISFQQTDAGPEWIKAPELWSGNATTNDIGSYGEGVVIGIIDGPLHPDHIAFSATDETGYTHTNPLGDDNYLGWCDPENPEYDPEINCNSKMIGFWDFSGDGLNLDNWHGMHVGSTAAGNFSTAFWDEWGYEYEPQVSGVAPRANVIGYNVCGSGRCQLTAVVEAIEQAVIDGVDILNESIIMDAIDPFEDSKPQAYFGALEAGILGVRSASNRGPSPGSISAEPAWVMTVGYTSHHRSFGSDEVTFDPDNADVLIPASARGPALNQQVLKPDLVAPGAMILAADMVDPDTQDYAPYRTASGTSMASPHAAGGAALLRALQPDWTPMEIMSAMTGTSVWQNIRDFDDNPVHPLDVGGGRIDLERAVNTGLILDETMENLSSANPNKGGDPRQLNLVGLFDDRCYVTCSWSRTFVNPTSRTIQWETEYQGPGTIQLAPSSFEVEPGQSVEIDITMDVRVTDTQENAWEQGRILLSPDDDETPEFNLPVAAFALRTTSNHVPPTITIKNDNSHAEHGEEIVFTIELTIPQAGNWELINEVPNGLELLNNSLTSGLEESIDGVVSWQDVVSAPTTTLETTTQGPGGYLQLTEENSSEVTLFETNPNWQIGQDIDYVYMGLREDIIFMSAHGVLRPGRTFGNTAHAPFELPNSTAEFPIAAPLWMEYELDSGESWHYAQSIEIGEIAYAIYEWRDMVPEGNTELSFTFQVWIERDSDRMWFVYGPGDWEELVNLDATIGFQDKHGELGYSMLSPEFGQPPSEDEVFHLIYKPEQFEFSYRATRDASTTSPLTNEVILSHEGQVRDSAWTGIAELNIALIFTDRFEGIQ